ncbi:hypothetical protein TBLA_0A02875 [Henningerozyma blattae CBS 6284]|uniref:Brl1/Brr6 domain-containing protein n=1 Tax=Henningerozyma blattae (strain ATCC 34711 / CBS 6284 / DSM 70876 / NBRC 10599 / NRRL Y-10934 / UCD 77-7) TaxID=1071380 RepID=I2GVD5_HENB6|nr:hypothetical protein TBLA_0A02875 [Tetrapisispora blattae CBS 6284]CCH58087.1 hypothetical protein TBLA_0A02875 [Tetrapisispora blattae CBS 6284]
MLEDHAKDPSPGLSKDILSKYLQYTPNNASPLRNEYRPSPRNSLIITTSNLNSSITTTTDESGSKQLQSPVSENSHQDTHENQDLTLVNDGEESDKETTEDPLTLSPVSPSADPSSSLPQETQSFILKNFQMFINIVFFIDLILMIINLIKISHSFDNQKKNCKKFYFLKNCSMKNMDSKISFKNCQHWEICMNLTTNLQNIITYCTKYKLKEYQYLFLNLGIIGFIFFIQLLITIINKKNIQLFLNNNNNNNNNNNHVPNRDKQQEKLDD